MSRRRRTGIVLLCLLLAALSIALDRSRLGNKWLLRLGSPAQTPAYDFKTYHGKTFTVVRVVDGDTIDIDAPDGRHDPTRIRLRGIDTPETRSEELGVMYFGPEAAEFTKGVALGKPVTAYLDEGNDTTDDYGRLLAYVQLPNGDFLNEVLLSEGFAYAYLRFRHSFYNKYMQLEAGARSLKKGLWENAKREQLPQWLQRERSTLLVNR